MHRLVAHELDRKRDEADSLVIEEGFDQVSARGLEGRIEPD